MVRLTWADQRSVIQRQINAFFRRRIDVAPRAMAALQAGASPETLDDEQPSVFEHSVLEALLRSSPACLALLAKAGAQIDRLTFPPTTDEPAPLEDATLEWIFRGVESKRLVPAASRIRKTRYLDETDILVAALEAAQRGQEPNEFGSRLLEAAGLQAPPKIRGAWADPGWQHCDAYLKRIADSVKRIALADPSHALPQFMIYEDETRNIRVCPFGSTELARLESSALRKDECYLYRGNVLQPVRAVSPELPPSALDEFADLLNTQDTSEHDFQRFFERYPLLLTGLDFARAHPQPVLYRDDGGTLIPDFFLERLSSGWDAILDLKRPYDELVSRRQNRTYFRQIVSNAVAQLRFYREWFDSRMNRALFAKHYGIQTFRPKMVIVIGRRHHFRDDIERIRLMDGLPQSTELWTYDDLHERARRYLQLYPTVSD